jgi:hypothetical protein
MSASLGIGRERRKHLPVSTCNIAAKLPFRVPENPGSLVIAEFFEQVNKWLAVAVDVTPEQTLSLRFFRYSTNRLKGV